MAAVAPHPHLVALVRAGARFEKRSPRHTPRGGRGVSAIEPEPIRTERLELLPLRVAHAEEMAPVLGDPALHTYIGGTPDTLQELRSRYQRLCADSPDPAASWLNWVIRLRDEDRLTGTVQTTISPTSHGLAAEIAWVVGTAWQGRGHRHRSRRSTRRLARTAAAAQRHRPHPPRSPGLCRSRHRCRARAHRHMAQRRASMAPKDQAISSPSHKS